MPHSAVDVAAERYAELRAACKQGDAKTIRRLVEGGCDVNYGKLDCYDFTPLHYAAWKGRTEAITMLAALGAKPNPINR